MKNELVKRFGAKNISELAVADGEMPLLLIHIGGPADLRVLVTNGLHQYKMPVPEAEKGKEFNELFFCLPSYWEPEDTDNPKMNWIYYWIQRLAKYVQEKETWFGHGHTMPCGKEALPLSETMKQNFFMLSDPILLEKQMRPIQIANKEVRFLAIIPLFEKEFTYKRGKTTKKLLKKFAANQVDERLDDFRESVMKSRIFHRR